MILHGFAVYNYDTFLYLDTYITVTIWEIVLSVVHYFIGILAHPLH